MYSGILYCLKEERNHDILGKMNVIGDDFVRSNK